MLIGNSILRRTEKCSFSYLDVWDSLTECIYSEISACPSE